MFNFSEFKSCKDTPPTKDGTYLVIRMYNGELSYACSLPYMVMYGWNTYINLFGEYVTDSRIVFDDDTMWTEVTEAKNDRPTENPSRI